MQEFDNSQRPLVIIDTLPLRQLTLRSKLISTAIVISLVVKSMAARFWMSGVG
jgi:hypothetical protein